MTYYVDNWDYFITIYDHEPIAEKLQNNLSIP